MNENAPLFRLVDLEVKRRKHRIRFDNIEVPRGAFVLITGRSGSGKTTFLNVIGLALRARGRSKNSRLDSTILQDGRLHNLQRFGNGARARIRREQIGYVTQSNGMFPFLTLGQNIAVSKTAAGRAGRSIRELAQDLEIDDLLRQLPTAVSGGQLQRAAVVRALASNPSVIIADEPTANLGVSHRDDVFEVLQAQNRENGTTVILATHDTDIIQRNAFTHHICLRPGSGSGEEVTESDFYRILGDTAKVFGRYAMGDQGEVFRYRIRLKTPERLASAPVVLPFEARQGEFVVSNGISVVGHGKLNEVGGWNPEPSEVTREMEFDVTFPDGGGSNPIRFKFVISLESSSGDRIHYATSWMHAPNFRPKLMVIPLLTDEGGMEDTAEHGRGNLIRNDENGAVGGAEVDEGDSKDSLADADTGTSEKAAGGPPLGEKGCDFVGGTLTQHPGASRGDSAGFADGHPAPPFNLSYGGMSPQFYKAFEATGIDSYCIRELERQIYDRLNTEVRRRFLEEARNPVWLKFPLQGDSSFLCVRIDIIEPYRAVVADVQFQAI
jgi:putative ABC transport system ATP-binding protein